MDKTQKPKEKSLDEWLLIIDKKIAEIEKKSQNDNDILNKNNKFVYEENEIKIAQTQCELCKYNDISTPNKCKVYKNGKTQEIILNTKKCDYLTSQNNIL